ncbi:hypothetical protein ACTXMO_10260 [Glutamicibacter arilaitensis]
MNSNTTAASLAADLVPLSVTHPYTARGRAPSPEPDGLSAVAFFPGLGSRAAYRNIDMDTVASSAAATEIYEEAAQALGQVPTSRALATDSRSLPEDPVERQGYIGAAFLTHNLALHSDLQDRNRHVGALQFSAYTGESFGMLAAAVAAGSLTVRDGALLAYAFTPILLGASNQHARGASAVDLGSYVPRYPDDALPVSEPSHVIALRGQADDLTRLMQTLDQVLGSSVELHKRYSPRQYNVYVTASAIPAFVRVLRSYPEITAEELKKATTFLAHSRRMTGAREAFDRFIDGHGIVFSDPHTPLISNSGAGFLLTGDQVRNAVLAMTDEVMDSQHTTELIDELQPDLVAEIGRGAKSLQLLRDNAVCTGAISISNGDEAQNLVRMAELARQLHETVRQVDDRASGLLDADDVAVLRELTVFAANEPAFDAYLRKTALALAFDSLRNPEKVISLTSTRFREALQFTLAHRDRVQPGEIVLGARVRKRLHGEISEIGHAYLELRVLTGDGAIREDEVGPSIDTEVLIVHFERPSQARIGAQIRHAVRTGLRGNPLAQRTRDTVVRQMRSEGLSEPEGLAGTIAHADAVDHLVYQSVMFELFQKHRPGLFAHSHVFFEATDLFGWVTSLVVAKALAPGDAVEVLTELLQRRSTKSGRLHELVHVLCERLEDSGLPLLSTTGAPVLARGDLRRETLAFLDRTTRRGAGRPVQLQASATVVALAYGSQLHRVDASPHHHTTLLVRTPEELWRYGLNSELDALESHALLNVTRAHRAVREFAQSRNMLYSTVNSYIHPGERIVGFGAGGSESMTIFFRQEGDDELLVRKVLSEALTTARWDAEGTGAMLPPFTKAKRQAEYLAALPDELNEFLPRVKNVTERQLRVAENADEVSRELIYEMTFIEGVEVGQYVRRHNPPTAVIAKLYEQIMTFIHHNVHTHRRTPSPGGTLEEQYFRKIEDRLALCRQTAPRTFSSELLDSDEIIINGHRYRNYRSLLRAFRNTPAYARILEARVHALVIGDTNTENIKIGDIAPLQRAAHLIRTGAAETDIRQALGDITPSSIGLKFLDPRAIGFRTEGAQTLDDPMYDNKPWHNSIGHYDEMHNEFFDLELSTIDGTPDITVRFHEGNPYQQAYQVRDVTEHGQPVDHRHPSGIEDYFAQVMAAVYESDEHTKAQHALDDPYWITRFVFTMGTHFTAMPPFHFASEIDGSVIDSPEVQRRPLAIYCEGIKWLNWALEMLEGTRTDFLGVPAPNLSCLTTIA